MPNYRTSGSSSRALTPAEKAVAEYWADAETMRCRPQNPQAYRAVVLARKRDEILASGALTGQLLGEFVAEAVRALEPEVPYEAPIDPLIARQRRAEGLAQGRSERAALLAQMTSEQGRDASWAR